MNSKVEKDISFAFQTYQVNGQRISVNLILSVAGEGHEIFIGHLPRDLQEDELLPILLSVGQLCEVRLMMNFSGFNRGFAFARFANQISADYAVKFLNNYEIRAGCRIAVLASRDKKKLFLGRLPKHVEESKITEILHTITGCVKNVELREHVRNGVTRRYGIVEYVSHMDACKARRELVVNGKKIFQTNVVVDWALVHNEEIDTQREFLVKRNNESIKNRNSVFNKTQNKNCALNVSKLATEMENLWLRPPKQRNPSLDRICGSVCGSASPTDSCGSEGEAFDERTVHKINFLDRQCRRFNENLIKGKAEPVPRRRNKNYNNLKATMKECQLCGPKCCFARKPVNNIHGHMNNQFC